MLLAALLGLPFLVLRAPRAASAGTTVDVPASIDATGHRDVTQELDAFLARVPDGVTVRFPANGRFHVEGVVLLVGRHDLTVEGNGATLVATTDGSAAARPQGKYRLHWPRLREHVEIRKSTNVTVRDLTVRGPNDKGAYVASLEGQAGFAITKSDGVLLDGVSATDTYGDGVYVFGVSHSVTVRDCTLERNGRQGVAIVNAEQVTVEGCTIRAAGRSVFDLEPLPAWRVRAVHLRKNTIDGYHNFLLAAAGAGPGMSDVWLEGNVARGDGGVTVFAGIDRFVRQGIHIVGNRGEGTATGHDGVVMQITRFDGVEVRDNHQRVDSGSVAVATTGSCNVVFTGNDFPGASEARRSAGDCTGTPQTRVTPRPPSTSRPGGSPDGPQPSSAAPPSHSGSSPDASPVVVLLSVLVGVLAGVAGTIAVQRARESRDR